MSDSSVPVPTTGTPRNIDVEEQVVGAVTVERQRVILVPGTSPHGCTPYHKVAAGSGDAGSVKSSPGQVYGWRIWNDAGYPIYVKLHNTASAPTPGAGVVQTIGVQAGESDAEFIPVGIGYDTGIGISIVKGIADSDATPVVASDCVVDLFYA